jgi:hypothetical protein
MGARSGDLAVRLRRIGNQYNTEGRVAGEAAAYIEEADDEIEKLECYLDEARSYIDELLDQMGEQDGD